MNGAVILNVVIMMITYANQPQSLTDIQDQVGVACTFVFLFELGLETTAFGFKRYLSKFENQINFVVTIIATLDMYMYFTNLCASGSAPLVKLIRCLRVTRMLKFLGFVPSLRVLIIALLRPIPTLASLALVIFLILLSISVATTTLFAHVPLTDDGLNEYSNFKTVFNSLMSMYYIATGENYAGYFLACKSATPDGVDKGLWAFVCFFLFYGSVLLMNFLVLNMFTMVVVESYELLSSEAYGLTQVHISCLHYP